MTAENNFKRVLIFVKDLNQTLFIFFIQRVILFCILIFIAALSAVQDCRFLST